MPRIPSRGVPSAVGSKSDTLRSALSGKLGDANMQRGGIGLGRVEPGRSPGSIDCEYVKLKLTAAVTDYTVRHERGIVPGLADKAGQDSPTGIVYNVTAIDHRKWTFSTVRVRVTPVAGATVTNDTVLVRIGGEKAGG